MLGEELFMPRAIYMRQLTEAEINQVSGGAISDDTGYGGSLGAAGGFLAGALALSNPIGIAGLAAASIACSGIAIYYALK